MEPKKEQEEKYLNPARSKKEIIINNFLGGIAWSWGTIIGATIIFTIIGLVLSKINFNFVPIIGNFLTQIITFVQKGLVPTQ